MVTTAFDRLLHIRAAIVAIHNGIGGLTADIVEQDDFLFGGFRYQLLTISEAARNIPEPWKQEFGPSIGWRALEAIGNRLRHAYQHANVDILWSIYEHDLDPLEAAIDAMIAAHKDDKPRG